MTQQELKQLAKYQAQILEEIEIKDLQTNSSTLIENIKICAELSLEIIKEYLDYKNLCRTIIMLILLLMPSICLGFDLQAADVVLYKPVGQELSFAQLRCPQIDFWYHADIATGESDDVVTSAPPDGCGSTSALSNRIESGDWSEYAVLRNDTLTDDQIDDVLDTAFSLDCEYDWFGFYLHWLDFALFCGDVVLFRAFEELSPNYHCLSFVAYCEGFLRPHVSLPWNWMGRDWQIVYREEL